MFLRIAIVGLVSVLSVSANATEATIATKVNRILIQDGVYGGCMITPSVSLTDKGLDCPNSFVSLDCDGVTGTSKATGARMLDQATLAKVTGGRLLLRISDEVKINGFCAAVQLRTL